MAASTKCLRYLALVTYVLFMVLGVTSAVLALLLLLPLVSLLTLPKWLLPPLLLPLLPALLALPVGFFGFSVTRNAQTWRIVGLTALQVLFAVAMAVLAGWQLFLCFSARIEADFGALMNESLHDTKWHTVYHELRCCGPMGPASFVSSGIPTACCSRDEDDAAGPCAQLYNKGCVAPAADRVRKVLKEGAAVQGGTALFMFLCALSTAFYADALKKENKMRRTQQETQEDKPLRSPMLNQRF